MKFLVKSTLIIAVLFISNQALAQAKDTTFIVNGVCNMCKNTIEKSLKIEGVEKSNWDVSSKVLSVRFDEGKTNLDKIIKAITDSGYDTEFKTAPDEAYEALHNCCHYRDPEIVKEHTKQ